MTLPYDGNYDKLQFGALRLRGIAHYSRASMNSAAHSRKNSTMPTFR